MGLIHKLSDEDVKHYENFLVRLHKKNHPELENGILSLLYTAPNNVIFENSKSHDLQSVFVITVPFSTTNRWKGLLMNTRGIACVTGDPSALSDDSFTVDYLKPFNPNNRILRYAVNDAESSDTTKIGNITIVSKLKSSHEKIYGQFWNQKYDEKSPPQDYLRNMYLHNLSRFATSLKGHQKI